MKKRYIFIPLLILLLFLGGILFVQYYPAQKKLETKWPKAEGNGWTVSVDDTGALIRLDANPSTGYEWSLVECNGPISIDRMEYLDPDTEGQELLSGSQGTEEIFLTANMEGSAYITLQYARPWEGSDQFLRFSFDIDEFVQISHVSCENLKQNEEGTYEKK